MIKEFSKTDSYQQSLYEIAQQIISEQREYRKRLLLLHLESLKALTTRRDCTKGETREFDIEQAEKYSTSVSGTIQMSQHTKGSTTNERHKKAMGKRLINAAEVIWQHRKAEVLGFNRKGEKITDGKERAEVFSTSFIFF